MAPSSSKVKPPAPLAERAALPQVASLPRSAARQDLSRLAQDDSDWCSVITQWSSSSSDSGDEQQAAAVDAREPASAMVIFRESTRAASPAAKAEGQTAAEMISGKMGSMEKNEAEDTKKDEAEEMDLTGFTTLTHDDSSPRRYLFPMSHSVSSISSNSEHDAKIRSFMTAEDIEDMDRAQLINPSFVPPTYLRAMNQWHATPEMRERARQRKEEHQLQFAEIRENVREKAKQTLAERRSKPEPGSVFGPERPHLMAQKQKSEFKSNAATNEAHLDPFTYNKLCGGKPSKEDKIYIKEHLVHAKKRATAKKQLAKEAAKEEKRLSKTEKRLSKTEQRLSKTSSPDKTMWSPFRKVLGKFVGPKGEGAEAGGVDESTFIMDSSMAGSPGKAQPKRPDRDSLKIPLDTLTPEDLGIRKMSYPTYERLITPLMPGESFPEMDKSEGIEATTEKEFVEALMKKYDFGTPKSDSV